MSCQFGSNSTWWLSVQPYWSTASHLISVYICHIERHPRAPSILSLPSGITLRVCFTTCWKWICVLVIQSQRRRPSNPTTTLTCRGQGGCGGFEWHLLSSELLLHSSVGIWPHITRRRESYGPFFASEHVADKLREACATHDNKSFLIYEKFDLSAAHLICPVGLKSHKYAKD